MKRRHEYLRSRGIAYLTTIVPEKFTIYPEHLPSWVAPGRNPTLLARTLDRLAEDGTVPYVDLRPLLRDAKSREQLYYLTDSHWNLAGAGVALRRDHAGRADPAAGTPRVHCPTGAPAVHPGPRRLLGRSRQSHGHPLSVRRSPTTCRLPRPGSPPARPARQIDHSERDGHIRIYEQPNADLPRLVMNRDSMGIALIPMLAENFHRSVYVLAVLPWSARRSSASIPTS